jgi:dsRNA-specific ribonuclease
MRKTITDYLRQKFPNLSKGEIEAYRFIDSNIMEDTGMDLDNFYQTTIVQALDDSQKSRFISFNL